MVRLKYHRRGDLLSYASTQVSTATVVKLTPPRLAHLFIVIGAALRILLWWANPPSNSFDNHFEPIVMIMQTRATPAKDACWQCYHPPVFYWISAIVGSVAARLGFGRESLLKLLQFLPCLYGVLTLVVIHRILLKLPLGEFERVIALGAVCFLPRHIYMSAMNSNDTISYLFVACTIDLLLLALDKKLAWASLAAASASMTVTLFTKYTTYAIFPAFFVAFALLFWKRLLAPRPQIVTSFGLVMLVPVLVLGLTFISNVERYGALFPGKPAFDPASTQARDPVRMDFFSFKPWESIGSPILVPGKMHSMWTIVYTGVWFDNEPKFICLTDGNLEFWNHYYGWLRGEETFPGANPAMSVNKIIGSVLVALGLVPVGLFVYGIYLRRSLNAWVEGNESDKITLVKLTVLLALLLGNAAIVVAFVVQLPVFSAAKASYLLNSLPAFAAFLAVGLAGLQKHAAWKTTIAAACGVLFCLVVVHIVHIAYVLLVESPTQF